MSETLNLPKAKKRTAVATRRINEQIKELRKGRHVVIENKSLDWWKDKYKEGLFNVLVNRELPVKVIRGYCTTYFNEGIDRRKVLSIMESMD